MPGAATFDYLIVGGGLAASSAIDGILETDTGASIALITDEAEPPYQRPPLSKEFIQYPDVPRSLLYVKPDGWFSEHANVELVTRQKAMVLDPASMTVTTSRGNVFGAPRILLATGGRARRLDVPGTDLDGVFTLRSVEDAEAIREAIVGASRAVLVGAGFVGMELAASLAGRGVASVVIESTDRVWGRALTPELSRWMRSRFELEGVSFRLNASVGRIEGPNRVTAVQVGEESVPCDLVVVGIGMDPCDGIALDAGLAVADGVCVDAYGETTHPHVYAAGDVARFPDPVFGGHTRVEHWEHAREHGRAVGRNMAGRREPYELLSHFFSRVFDLNLDVVGRPAEADDTVLWGAPGDGPCVAFALAEGRLCGIALVDASEELETARLLVRRRLPGALLDSVPGRAPASLGELAVVAAREMDRTS